MTEHFYKNGLNFECTQCSKCCRFDPGYVFLSYNDLNRLVKFFNLTETDFIDRYCRKIDMGENNRLSLLEKSNYDCIFWSDGGCEVYESRPLQCRSYPFWTPFLTDMKSWNHEAESCPGMNKGKLISKEIIEEWLQKRIDDKLILL